MSEPKNAIQLISERFALRTSNEFKKPEVVPEGFQNVMLKDFPEDTYHADLTAVARGDVLARLKSPAHFVARRQQTVKEDNDAFRFGRAVHTMLLEPKKFLERFTVMPDFGDMRSSKNRENRDAWQRDQAPGSLALSAEEAAQLVGIGRSIAANPAARALFQTDLCETTCYYRDPATGLKTRVRPDIVNRELSAIVDLKTTQSADFEEFQRSAWKYRYDLQLSMYASGVHSVTGEYPENLVIVAVEKTPPYGVQVFELDALMKDRGLQDYRRGMDGIAESLIKNEWPCYPEEVTKLSLPKWVALGNK